MYTSYSYVKRMESLHINNTSSTMIIDGLVITLELTKEKKVACPEECPNGSICHPTVGYTPKLLAINRSPIDI